MNKTEKTERSYTERIKTGLSTAKRKLKSQISNAFVAITRSRLVKVLFSEKNLSFAYLAIRCIALALCGFVFGKANLGFGVYPLGLSLLISSGELSFFSYMGSAIACLTYDKNGFAFFGINTLIYIIRKLLLSDTFSESKNVRTVLACFTGIFIFGALLCEGTLAGKSSLSSDTLLRGISYIITLPVCSYLLYPTICYTKLSKVSVLFFCACLTMSLNFVLPGLFGSVLFACLTALFFSLCFDEGFALLSCVILGFATLQYSFCAPLCVAAFVYIRLFSRNIPFAHIGFSLTCSALMLFTCNLPVIGYSTIGAVLLSSLLFLPVACYIRKHQSQASLDTPKSAEVVGEAYTRRISSLSGAFNSVSKLCYGYSGRMKFVTQEEATVICSVVSAKHCSTCEVSKMCKLKHLYSGHEITSKLLSGKLTSAALPEKLKSLCRHPNAICEGINGEYRKTLSDRFRNNKTEILAREYSTVAKILKYTSRLSGEDTTFDRKMTNLAYSATKKLGLPFKSVSVYGTRKKTFDICGVPVSSVTKPSENMAAYYSSECGVIFAIPEFIFEENGTFTIRFVSKEVITVEYVKASHTKSGEVISGDTISFFKSDDSFFYALIADGMGSGRDAAMTSKITSVFIEKLLCGGAGKGVTIELLNSLLMSKNKECFSSVDLLELDLLSKKASFIKAGAAPAYLMRSAKLFKVSSDTPPCGIIEGFSAENTSFDVFSGDTIIMLSDGISSSIDCGTSLCRVMSENAGASCETVASKILDLAVSASTHDDDMSCVLVKVK